MHWDLINSHVTLHQVSPTSKKKKKETREGCTRSNITVCIQPPLQRSSSIYMCIMKKMCWGECIHHCYVRPYAKSKETRGMIEHNSEVYNHPYISFFIVHVYMEKDLCRGGCILHCYICSIIPLVSLLFAVLVSLHPVTFLMFFVSVPKHRDTVLGTYIYVRLSVHIAGAHVRRIY